LSKKDGISEISQLYVTCRRDKDIIGLNVSVHNSTFVQKFEALDSSQAYVPDEVLIVLASPIFDNLSESSLVHEL
jgi:hypothetical protein